MRKLAWIVAPLFFATASTSAEIFKCAGKNGVIVYQNFRCEIDSLGSLPSSPRTTPAPTAKQVKPAAVAMNSSTTLPAEPAVGMTTEEVRAIWGEPTDTFNEEPGKGGRVEVWAYGSDRSVRFDHRSRVTAVHKQGG
ncbi:MAG TPA: DUF4124 domain-containing protein [Casimicrobiaceae bacterium]|jgi:hypothetical protein